MTASTSAEFLAGERYSIDDLYLDGAAVSYVWIRSTTPSSQYYFDILNTTTLVTYANVEDNNACYDPIIAEDGTNVDENNNSCWSFIFGATADLSSAANQNFVVDQATTTVSTITITDTVVPTITASNDIRIIIATTTVDMLWDTTDTLVTLGGSASGKASTTVSYSANGDTLIIDVESDFVGSDTLTVSGLSFAQFNTFSSPTNALGIRIGGAGTTTNNADDKTVSISGGLTLGNHSGGSIPNNFSNTSGTGESLYGFSLLGVGESVDISNLVIQLTSVVNILSADLTNLLLYRDINNDKLYDGGDVAVGGSGTPSISGAYGTITFGTTFTEDTTVSDYLLIGDYANVKPGEAMTLSLGTSDITATGVTSGGSITPSGSADSKEQYRKGKSGGGGRGEVGGGAPDGGEDQTGGDEGGGGGGEAGVDPDTGTSLGSEPGFVAPTSNSGSWTNPGNAYDSDGSYTSSTAVSQTHSFGTFGFTVPSDNDVIGIEVKLEAHDSDVAGDIDIELSWNGGANYTSANNTGTLTATDAVYVLGGPADDWGHTWTPTETDDGNLEIRLTSLNDTTVSIDAMQIKVYHQISSSTVGGGGGGGEVSIPSSQHFANVFFAFGEFNMFTQILLFAALMSMSIAFSFYIRERHRKEIVVPNSR